MIKLIASDIDGTLLSEGTDQINPELYETILKLKEQDVLFAAASGRQYPSIRRLFASIENDIIFIAENGSYVTCRGKDMSIISMERSDVVEIVEWIRKQEGCHVTVSAKDVMYVETEEESFINLLVHGYHNTLEIVEDVLKLPIDIIKISIFNSQGIHGIIEKIPGKWKEKLNIAEAGDIWIDFMDPRADKGSALQTIQSLMRISPEETMVFGDNLNDIGMIRAAGESYAVGNARKEVKEAAKYIVDTNVNDGVLKELKKLLKTEMGG